MDLKELERAGVDKTTRLKLSEAIREGKKIIREESALSFCLCAVGCIFAADVGREMTGAESDGFLSFMNTDVTARNIARYLGRDEELFSQINRRHLSSQPALSIADWLEAQGL